MRIQVLFLFLSFLPLYSQAACFDFDAAKVVEPIVQAQTSSHFGTVARGKLSEVTWASLSGEVQKPIGELLKLFLDHDNTKSTKVDEVEVEKKASSTYLERHLVKFLIKPFPFVKIRWQEDWTYALAEGSVAKPSKITISYQKIEGTSHIEHLCGSIVLRKLSETSTDVFQYEEAKATQRKPQDTLTGLKGTLEMLRTHL